MGLTPHDPYLFSSASTRVVSFFPSLGSVLGAVQGAVVGAVVKLSPIMVSRGAGWTIKCKAVGVC